MAALEEPGHQSEEADAKRDREGNGLHLGLQWAGSLVELGSITHAFRVSSQMVHSAGTHKPAFTTSTFSELVTNRRMPTGTYGGVRGWGREAPAYSINLWSKWRSHETYTPSGSCQTICSLLRLLKERIPVNRATTKELAGSGKLPAT